jgi:sugar lactone lactonase YvrE
MHAGTSALTTLLLCIALSLSPLTSPATALLNPGDIVVLDRSGGMNRRGSLVRIDPATGARMVLSDFRDAAQGPLGHIPTGVAVLPTGKTILVADPSAGTHSRGVLFRIDAGTGVRTVQYGFGPPAQTPQWVALDAAGDALVSDQHADLDRTTPGRGGLFKVALAPRDPRTPLTVASDYGDPTQGPTSANVDAVVVVPFQFTLGDIVVPEGRGLIPWTGLVTPGVLVRVDPVTGERHIFSSFQNRGQGPLGTPQAVTFDGAGNLLVTARRLGRNRPGILCRVDPATGVRTVVSDFGNIAQGPLGGVPGAITTDARGNLLVLAADVRANHRVLLFSVDPTSGERRILSNFNDRDQGPRGVNPTSVAADAAGTILVVDRNAGNGERGVLFHIDPATGNRRVVTNFNSLADAPLAWTRTTWP